MVTESGIPARGSTCGVRMVAPACHPGGAGNTGPGPLSDAAQHDRGGDRGRGCLVPLVLARPRQPGPVAGLLFVVTGQDAEADRQPALDADLGQAPGGGLADVVE